LASQFALAALRECSNAKGENHESEQKVFGSAAECGFHSVSPVWEN
jgi:hypothetical protein